jgi:predicted glycosyltransferase involved in capsule biosynthesis
MDGDDYCSYDRFEKQINFLKNHKEYQLVSSNANCFDENGIWGERIFDEIITKNSFLFTSPIQHGSILTYRWCYEKVGGYSEKSFAKRNEDYELFMRMFASGIKMYTIQEKLYYYRVDDVCYSKRKYKYRVNEVKVRARGFKLLKLYPKGFIYVVKPLIVGLIPKSLLHKIHKKNSK